MNSKIIANSTCYPDAQNEVNENEHDSSFDSLPPGSKYHMPPIEEDYNSNNGDVICFDQQNASSIINCAQQVEVETCHQVATSNSPDPFDTSAFVVPSATTQAAPSLQDSTLGRNTPVQNKIHVDETTIAQTGTSSTMDTKMEGGNSIFDNSTSSANMPLQNKANDCVEQMEKNESKCQSKNINYFAPQPNGFSCSFPAQGVSQIGGSAQTSIISQLLASGVSSSSAANSIVPITTSSWKHEPQRSEIITAAHHQQTLLVPPTITGIHRRAMSTTSDADNMLPPLTSPFSPPAFNPADIILGSNEAIAGLESPAMSMALPTSSLAASSLVSSNVYCSASPAPIRDQHNQEERAPSSEREKTEHAFNWLQSTMSNLKIGEKGRKGPPLSAGIKSQEINRNATVHSKC